MCDGRTTNPDEAGSGDASLVSSRGSACLIWPTHPAMGPDHHIAPGQTRFTATANRAGGDTAPIHAAHPTWGLHHRPDVRSRAAGSAASALTPSGAAEAGSPNTDVGALPQERCGAAEAGSTNADAGPLPQEGSGAAETGSPNADAGAVPQEGSDAAETGSTNADARTVPQEGSGAAEPGSQNADAGAAPNSRSGRKAHIG